MCRCNIESSNRADLALMDVTAELHSAPDGRRERGNMRDLRVMTVLIGSMLAGQCFAQSGAVIPEGGAGHAGQVGCVILKRMGPADQLTSGWYSFGIRAKQFQYVEGKLPEGFPFHGRLTDHDVR